MQSGRYDAETGVTIQDLLFCGVNVFLFKVLYSTMSLFPIEKVALYSVHASNLTPLGTSLLYSIVKVLN